MTDNYRWPYPYAWLESASANWDQNTLRQALLLVAIKCDSDSLQDLFQDEMEDDGYFDLIN